MNKSSTSEMLNPNEFEEAVKTIPEQAQEILEEAVMSGNNVYVHEMGDYPGKEYDETAGSGNNPYSRKVKVVFTDGTVQRGKEEKMGARGSIDNAGDWENTASVTGASVIITKTEERDMNHGEVTTDTRFLDVYSTSVATYDGYINRLKHESLD